MTARAGNKRLVVVQGPTGVGKTAVAVELARRLGGVPVVSADSRQFYREMTIGTAVPSPSELAAARHYFIQDRSVTEPLSAGQYEVEALALLSHLFGLGSGEDESGGEGFADVVLVGGSGLYVDALLHGFDELPPVPDELREAITAQPLNTLLEELREKDPVYYEQVDRANFRRVARAVEVCRQSGQPYSSRRSGMRRERQFGVVRIALDMPRAELYERIDLRVDAMIAAGLEAEACTLLPMRHLQALQTVGYSELFDYFDGLITRDEAIELIKRNSRRYAKRQLTWLRREGSGMRWFDPSDINAMTEWLNRDI